MRFGIPEQTHGFGYLARLFKALLILIFLSAVGVVGYETIEGWSFLESLYMTVITIATVGFKEVRPLSQAGMIFTIGLILAGVGVVGYTLGSITQLLVSIQLAETFGRRRVEREIGKIKNHYIVCGYGRMGRIICRELIQNKKDIVVIESNESARQDLEDDGMLYIIGDVTDEDTLLHAGIQRARSIIAAVKTDADNLYLTITARQLNPAIYIVSRAAEEGAEKKLLRAGANQVVSPYRIGGLRMANAILRPAVVDFLDMTARGDESGMCMEGIQVMPGSTLINKTLIESRIRDDLGLNIIAMKRMDGQIVTNPSGNTKIIAGDILITVGNLEAVQKLEMLVNKSETV